MEQNVLQSSFQTETVKAPITSTFSSLSHSLKMLY